MKRKAKRIAVMLVISLMLPVCAAAVTGTFTAAYVWEDGQAMPQFPALAETLDAIDTCELSFAEALATASLQGIVNRSQPRILLRNTEEEERDTWPELLELQYVYLLDWLEGVQKYHDELAGLIVWNPDIPETANVATTLAGIKDSLAVTPQLADLLSATPYNLSVVLDLRNEEKITDKLSAYRWLYDNYREQYTKKTVSGLIVEKREDGSFDGHMNMRDLSVAVKAPVVWLDAAVPAERALLKLFFNDTAPLDTFYTGWWPNESQGISFASSYGVTTVPSDFYLNYTVYSGMSKQLSIPTVPAKPELDNSKIYVCAIMSDGDNIQYDQGAMLIDRLWNSPDRGKMPIAWTASPVMLDAGPQILNYYYKTATENDVLICGPSGLGYSTSFEWPDEAFSRKYGRLTNDYFERSAFNVITVWHELGGRKSEWFMSEFPSLLGVTTQGLHIPKIRHSSTDKPMIWLGSDNITSIMGMGYEQSTDNIKRALSAAAKLPQAKAQFYACQVEVWFVGVPDYVNLRDDLERDFPGRFEFVRPDHFMMLINEAYNKPYNAALRQNANASANAGDAANAFDGSFTTGWEAEGGNWLSVDLGQEYKINRYVLKNAETNYQDSTLNTKAWRLQVSNDGENWRTIDTVTNNSDAIAYREAKADSARYVRLLIDDPGADGVARVQDMEIYGIKAKDATLCSSVFESIRGVVTWFFNIFFDIFYPIFFGIQGMLEK